MTLNEFKQSDKGQRLALLFADPAVIDQMVAISGLGRPAVKAIDAIVADAVETLDNVEKQHVGRWVRDVLAQRGMKPVRQLDWRGGRMFSSGMIYAPISVPPRTEPTTAAPDVARARAILAAGRRDPAQPIDRVAAFLADRRLMWGDI